MHNMKNKKLQQFDFFYSGYLNQNLEAKGQFQ